MTDLSLSGLRQGLRTKELQAGARTLGTKEGWPPSKDEEDEVGMGGQHSRVEL